MIVNLDFQEDFILHLYNNEVSVSNYILNNKITASE